MASLPVDASRLLTQLNISGLQQSNNPLYQLIKQLIVAVTQLNASSNSTGNIGPVGPAGKDGIPGFLLSDSGSNDEAMIVPGPPGIAGAAGAAGTAGISGFMIAEDGIDGDLFPIPGPTGATGATGAAGNVTWSLLFTSTPTLTNTVDFIGLAGYTDIRVLVRLITFASADEPVLRVSTDNGATYLAASGDYKGILGVGTEANHTSIEFYAATGTTGKTGEISIAGFNLTTPKVTRANFFSTDGVNLQIIPVASALNAIRVLSAAGQNFTGGTIYVFGR